MNTVHKAIMTISGNRLGWTAANMPVLELTTIGRKSGKARTTILTSPWQDGHTMAIVASRGGDDINPAWFLNLRDNPEVTVKTGKQTQTMTARIVPSAERAEIWEAITSKYSNYAGYQKKTDREIPVVLLDPVL